MARRSPMNPRYQKSGAPSGKTRKSAAGARPKREAGGQGTAAPKKKSTRPSIREAMANQPAATPEMKKWRRVSIGLLAAGFVIFTLTWFVPAFKTNNTLTLIGFILYALCLAGAIFIDYGIIRKLRMERDAAAKAERKKG